MDGMAYDELLAQIKAFPDAREWNVNAIEASFSLRRITDEQRAQLYGHVHGADDILTVLRRIKRFSFPQASRLAFPAAAFSAEQQTLLQTLCLNIQRMRGAAIAPMDTKAFWAIDQHIRSRFDVSLDRDPRENVQRFVTWLDTFLLLSDRPAVLQHVRSVVAHRYGADIAEEVVGITQIQNMDSLMALIEVRIGRLKTSTRTLTKQDILELVFLKYISARIIEGRKLGEARWQEEYELRKKRFNAGSTFRFFDHITPQQWNHDLALETVRMVIKANDDLHKRYAGHHVMFLARDGIIFYEAYRLSHPDLRRQASLLYVSRQTLNVNHGYERFDDPDETLFSALRKDLLDPAIDESGDADIEEVITTVQRRMEMMLRGETGSGSTIARFRQLTQSLHDHLVAQLDLQRVVFFDSSSRTLPVLLAAFCRMMFPQREFRAFFAITSFHDPRAGAYTGRKDYSTDLLMSEVKINTKTSTIVPYAPKIDTFGEPERRAEHFLSILLLYRELAS